MGIGDVGAFQIYQAVKTKWMLSNEDHSIDLSSNNIGREGCRELAQALLKDDRTTKTGNDGNKSFVIVKDGGIFSERSLKVQMENQWSGLFLEEAERKKRQEEEAEPKK